MDATRSRGSLTLRLAPIYSYRLRIFDSGHALSLLDQVSDSGCRRWRTLVLAVSWQFEADYVRTNFVEGLGKVTGRRTEVVVTDYARIRAMERRGLRDRGLAGRGF